MGDRASVYVKGMDNSPGVYLYTSWGGYELPVVVRNALVRGQERWNDDGCLARIVFCEMVKGAPMALTGFSISASLTSGDYSLLVLDSDKQTIGVCEEPDSALEDLGPLAKEMPMSEYIRLNDIQVKKFARRL